MIPGGPGKKDARYTALVTDSAEALETIPEEFLADGHIDLGVLGIVAWVTDLGLVRERNEDRLLVRLIWDGTYLLLVVADGAGGHERGDKAAEQVVLTFSSFFSENGSPPAGGPPDWLASVIGDAHLRVRALAQGEGRPPASTVVGLLIETASLCAWRFHVGDSRVYSREASGMVAQWTRDHNIANGLIDRGLAVSQAMKVAEGARLTQVLGGGVDQQPEVHGPLQLQAGQSLLIASDGIFGHNENREVLLPAMKSVEGATTVRAAALKAAVLAGEAPDNLTAIIWEVPDGLVATVARDTVTNSMPAVTDEEIGRRMAASAGEADDDDGDEDGPSLWSSAGLMALLLLLAVSLSVLRLVDASTEAGATHSSPSTMLETPEVKKPAPAPAIEVEPPGVGAEAPEPAPAVDAELGAPPTKPAADPEPAVEPSPEPAPPATP